MYLLHVFLVKSLWINVWCFSIKLTLLRTCLSVYLFQLWSLEHFLSQNLSLENQPQSSPEYCTRWIWKYQTTILRVLWITTWYVWLDKILGLCLCWLYKFYLNLYIGFRQMFQVVIDFAMSKFELSQSFMKEAFQKYGTRFQEDEEHEQ